MRHLALPHTHSFLVPLLWIVTAEVEIPIENTKQLPLNFQTPIGSYIFNSIICTKFPTFIITHRTFFHEKSNPFSKSSPISFMPYFVAFISVQIISLKENQDNQIFASFLNKEEK